MDVNIEGGFTLIFDNIFLFFQTLRRMGGVNRVICRHAQGTHRDSGEYAGSHVTLSIYSRG